MAAGGRCECCFACRRRQRLLVHSKRALKALLIQSFAETKLVEAGVFETEEIHDFSQDDLLMDDVYILDVWSEVFCWVGPEVRRWRQYGGSHTWVRRTCVLRRRGFAWRKPAVEDCSHNRIVPASGECWIRRGGARIEEVGATSRRNWLTLGQSSLASPGFCLRRSSALPSASLCCREAQALGARLPLLCATAINTKLG